LEELQIAADGRAWLVDERQTDQGFDHGFES